MSKVIFMVPVPDEYFTLFLHEISPDFSEAVYSKIDQGVTVTHKKKVLTRMDEEGLFIFDDHAVREMLAAQAYVCLHGVPEEFKNRLEVK